MSPTAGAAPFYKGWQLANMELVAALEHLTPAQLALPVGSPTWPIWASASHLAGARVYWLCHIFKEPGAETMPFTDPGGFGWEDDLAHPRNADELAGALASHTMRSTPARSRSRSGATASARSTCGGAFPFSRLAACPQTSS